MRKLLVVVVGLVSAVMRSSCALWPFGSSGVGIYALGITPRTEDNQTGAAELFSAWAGAIHYDRTGANGYPGVHVPE